MVGIQRRGCSRWEGWVGRQAHGSRKGDLGGEKSKWVWESPVGLENGRDLVLWVRPVILARQSTLGLSPRWADLLMAGSRPGAMSILRPLPVVLAMLLGPLTPFLEYSSLAFEILLKIPSVAFSFRANQPLSFLCLCCIHTQSYFSSSHLI